MKRCSIIVMVMVLFVALSGPAKEAGAMEIMGSSEQQMNEWYEMRTILQPYGSKLDIDGKVIMEETEVCLPNQQRDDNHTERILGGRHELYVNNELIAWVDVVCTVWDYPDGKVHLYRRTMSLTVTPGYEGSYLTYGSIFNTDGSYSGTTGDRVCITDGTHTAHFGLYFYVTRETYNFSSARVAP